MQDSSWSFGCTDKTELWNQQLAGPVNHHSAWLFLDMFLGMQEGHGKINGLTHLYDTLEFLLEGNINKKFLAYRFQKE